MKVHVLRVFVDEEGEFGNPNEPIAHAIHINMSTRNEDGYMQLLQEE